MPLAPETALKIHMALKFFARIFPCKYIPCEGTVGHTNVIQNDVRPVRDEGGRTPVLLRRTEERMMMSGVSSKRVPEITAGATVPKTRGAVLYTNTSAPK